MKNEPVAWMETYKGEPNNLDWDKSNLNYGSEFHDVIPLYTHPVKELALTDKEMISIYEKDWSGIKCGLGRAVEQAILRKAQE